MGRRAQKKRRAQLGQPRDNTGDGPLLSDGRGFAREMEDAHAEAMLAKGGPSAKKRARLQRPEDAENVLATAKAASNGGGGRFVFGAPLREAGGGDSSESSDDCAGMTLGSFERRIGSGRADEDSSESSSLASGDPEDESSSGDGRGGGAEGDDDLGLGAGGFMGDCDDDFDDGEGGADGDDIAELGETLAEALASGNHASVIGCRSYLDSLSETLAGAKQTHRAHALANGIAASLLRRLTGNGGVSEEEEEALTAAMRGGGCSDGGCKDTKCGGGGGGGKQGGDDDDSDLDGEHDNDDDDDGDDDDDDEDSAENPPVYGPLQPWRFLSHVHKRERVGDGCSRLAAVVDTIDFCVEADELIAIVGGERLVGPLRVQFLAELFLDRESGDPHGRHSEQFVLSWTALEEPLHPAGAPPRQDASEAGNAGKGNKKGADGKSAGKTTMPVSAAVATTDEGDGMGSTSEDDDDEDGPLLTHTVLTGKRVPVKGGGFEFSVEIDRDGIVRLARELCSSVNAAGHACATAMVLSRIGCDEWCDDDESSLLRCGDGSDLTALGDAVLEALDHSAGMTARGLLLIEQPSLAFAKKQGTKRKRGGDPTAQAQQQQQQQQQQPQAMRPAKGGNNNSSSNNKNNKAAAPPTAGKRRIRWGKNHTKVFSS